MYFTRQAKRIAPEKMSMQLADILYKLYFMERNMKLLVDYTASWPLLSFPAYIIPEILYIWVLSTKIRVLSPVPKLPLINPGLEYELQHFGWGGSVGFTAAAMISKKLSSNLPNKVSEAAVQQVLYEVEESMSSSSSLERVISDIEVCVKPSSASNEVNSFFSSEADLTSPMPARKNHSKCRNKDHSNKGGIGSHKLNHQKLQLSVKVQKMKKNRIRIISIIVFCIFQSVYFRLHNNFLPL